MNFVTAVAEGKVGCLALGAVQLGLSYGIANSIGKPDRKTAFSILGAAARGGIRVVDTAQAYGDSEVTIGQYLAQHPEVSFWLVSKPAPSIDLRNREQVLSAVRSSVARLGQPLAALLIHKPELLRHWSDGVGAVLQACVEEGLTECVGVSTYTPEEFELALSIPEIRVIQAPFNALDRRLLAGRGLERAIASGRHVFMRSLLLQGLLLLAPEDIPPGLADARSLIKAWREVCAVAGLPPLAVAVKYARQRVSSAMLLIGCERPEQVEENVKLALERPLTQDVMAAIDALPAPAERLVNPSLWPK